MRYGHFDDTMREYVIERPDIPVSWTNYLGVRDTCGLITHNAAGYAFHISCPDGRYTRFRPNGFPMDRPGRYVYIRDDDTGEFWTISWQPTGLDLNKAQYRVAHGLSYTWFECSYNDILAKQTVFIPVDDAAEIWAVELRNLADRPRRLSVFSYLEFSFRGHELDLQSFLYATYNSYEDGVIRSRMINYHGIDEQNIDYGTCSFTATFDPDSFDVDRDVFVGEHRTEKNPVAVDRGKCSGTVYDGGNVCGALHKTFDLEAGAVVKFCFLNGDVDLVGSGNNLRKKYSAWATVEDELAKLRTLWDTKLRTFQCRTPDEGLNSFVNIWNLYQTETCVTWSRFCSLVEIGDRRGLGYRDTSQDCMAVVASHRRKCLQRMEELITGQYSDGCCIHLVVPEEHVPGTAGPSSSAKRIYADDFMWMVATICEYVKETGDTSFLDKILPYADTGEATVYDHVKQGIAFTLAHRGKNNLIQPLFADWNDCLNLRDGGESSMLSCQTYWALTSFAAAARFIGRDDDAERYDALADELRDAIRGALWDGEWFKRAITGGGDDVGSHKNSEGKIFLNAQSWAVCSGVAERQHGIQAMDAVYESLFSEWGIHLLWPSYADADLEIGFVTAYPKGLKENGGIFCHTNPWAIMAECVLGRGNRAHEYYSALLPYNQNDHIEMRQSEPYSYCQFVVGREHPLHGRARHPWLTGTAGWMYTAATKYILGFRPDYDGFVIDPCIPSQWDGFTMVREFRGARYTVTVENPEHVEKGVREVRLNGRSASFPLPLQPEGSTSEITVIMG